MSLDLGRWHDTVFSGLCCVLGWVWFPVCLWRLLAVYWHWWWFEWFSCVVREYVGLV